MLRRGRPSQSLALDFHAARDSVDFGGEGLRWAEGGTPVSWCTRGANRTSMRYASLCDVVADQLGVLGADVIRVEHPYQVDLARQLGPDVALNERLLGTGYLTQGSNKCSLSLDLRNDLGREVIPSAAGRGGCARRELPARCARRARSRLRPCPQGQSVADLRFAVHVRPHRRQENV